MKDIFITGTSGVLGFETFRYLFQRKGAGVMGVSRRSLPANSLELPNMQVDSVVDALWLPENATHSTVVHFAGLADPRAQFEGYKDLSVREITPQIEMLERMLVRGWRGHLVYISSGGAIYGDVECFPIQEVEVPRPKGYYALQKLSVENALVFLANQYDFRLTILRVSNPYGSHVPKKGQGVIPVLLAAAMTDQTFNLIGTGDEVRDYLHISDFCRAIESVCEKSLEERINTINIGSGVGTSLNRLIDIVSRLTGKFINVSIQLAKYDVRSNVLDITRAKTLLGWSPHFTIEDGIARMVSEYSADS